MRRLIRHRFRNSAFAMVVLAAIAVATFSLLTAQTDPTSPVPVSLEGISGQQLAEAGLTLTVSNVSQSAAVSRQDAENTALRYVPPGAILRQSVLARVVDSHNTPPYENDAWVMAFDPNGVDFTVGPPGAPKGVTTLLIVLVDAKTGKFLYGVAKSVAAPNDTSISMPDEPILVEDP